MTSPRLDAARIAGDGTVHVFGERDVLLPWWSFGKTVLASAVLRLVEEGALDLDAPLPGRPFTARQLLQHRAGVPNYGGLADYHAAITRGEAPWSREELLARVGADRLDFAPGTGWAYSNVGYLFLREAIERLTGLPLGEAIASLVTSPLGLAATRLATRPVDLDAVPWPGLRGYDPGWVYHGCLVGPPHEACVLLRALLDGRLLRPETLSAMLVSHELGGAVPGRPWTRHGYGLGTMIGTMEGAGTAIGHTGGGPGGGCAVYRFPDLDPPVTAAAFMPVEHEGAVERAAVALALGAS